MIQYNLRFYKRIKASLLGIVIEGKGELWSVTSFLVTIGLTIGFVIMLILMDELPQYIFSLALFLGLVYVVYQFSSTIIEIALNDKVLEVKVFKKFHKYTLSDIKKIKIIYQRTVGKASFRVRTRKGIKFYNIWVPIYENERYNLLVDFVNYLRDNLGDQIEIKSNLKERKDSL